MRSKQRHGISNINSTLPTIASSLPMISSEGLACQVSRQLEQNLYEVSTSRVRFGICFGIRKRPQGLMEV